MIQNMKINRSVHVIIMLLILSECRLWSQQEIAVNYFRPYKYDVSQNSVRAWIDARALKDNVVISLDDKQLNLMRTDSGTIILDLPLVGKPGELIVKTADTPDGKTISFQIFRPLISSDWGFFSKGAINIICSSHQDIAWMNTPDSCREERIKKIIIPALDIIDKNPGYKFEMEQTLNLMEVLEAVPSERQRIVNAYKSGQFTWGATFNQPYEGLESDEQLVRQAYLGRKWIKDNLPGMDALAAYNVDVPGRTLQSPQILSKAGIKYLFVSRMKEGFCNWYSPDGSRILTYSPGNYGWSLLVYQYFEGDVITAMQKLHAVLENWDDYYRKHRLPPQFAVIISTDAGGPKDYSPIISEWNNIAKASGSDIPVVRHSTTEDFLGSIDVPGIQIDSLYGDRPDLWLYIHGPAHYEAIKAKKSASVTLPAAEIFSSLNGMVKGTLKDYPASVISKGWYKAIYPDHGWGGKHGEITDSIFRAALEEGNRTGQDVIGRSLQELASEVRLRNPNSILVYNDLSWKRTGRVDLDISVKKGTDWIIVDAQGKTIPSSVKDDPKKKTISFLATDVPAIGYTTYYLRKGINSSSKDIKAGSNYYENSFYSIEFGPGGISSLYDKELGKQVFNSTKYAGGDLLSIGYNGNGAGEFIQIKPTNFEGSETLSTRKTVWNLTENTPVAAVFESESSLRNFHAKVKITVYHHIKKIDFEYDIPDWPGEHNRQLRVAFPLRMDKAQISYDVPMGILNVGKDELQSSPLGWSWEGTYRQLPAQINPREIENFISASDGKIGVTVSTDLAVADWVDPGRESVDYPVLQGILLSSHKSCHYLGNWYHQTGSHQFRFSLTTHEPGWKHGYYFGVEGNHPLHPVLMEKKQSGTLPEELGFITVSSPFVRITAIKKSESGNSLIIRLVEMGGRDEQAEVKLYFPVKALYRTNLIEEEPTDTGQKGNRLVLDIGKNSIETFRMDF